MMVYSSPESFLTIKKWPCAGEFFVMEIFLSAFALFNILLSRSMASFSGAFGADLVLSIHHRALEAASNTESFENLRGD